MTQKKKKTPDFLDAGVLDLPFMISVGCLSIVFSLTWVMVRDVVVAQSLEREVAVKILPADVVAQPETLARFDREAKLLASLNHPGIAHLYGLESVTSEPGAEATTFLTMELVEGTALDEVLDRDGAMPAARVARRRGSSIRMRPVTIPASSSASGTRNMPWPCIGPNTTHSSSAVSAPASTSSKRRCWPARRPSTLPVNGCPTRPCTPSKNTSWPSKGH